METFLGRHIPVYNLWDQGAMSNSYFCPVATRNTTSKYFGCSISHPCRAGELCRLWMTALPEGSVPSLLPPLPQWGGHEQSEKPDSRGRNQALVFQPMGCVQTTRLSYCSPFLPLLTTNRIQQVSSPQEQGASYFRQVAELRFTSVEMAWGEGRYRTISVSLCNIPL